MSKSADYFDYTPLDGYAWAEQQARSIHGGLTADPAIGDWPYVIVVRGKRELFGDGSGKYIIREFCEHDVKTWIYTEAERDQYTQHLKELREYSEANY